MEKIVTTTATAGDIGTSNLRIRFALMMIKNNITEQENTQNRQLNAAMNIIIEEFLRAGRLS